MQILLLEDFPNIVIEHFDYLKKKKHQVITTQDYHKNEDIDVIIVRSGTTVNVECLDRYPNLKYVCRVWSWLDHIDLKECEKRDINIVSTPGANADSVADMTLAGILELSRKISRGFEWLENRFTYMWSELASRSVGIVWFWNIWKKVYQRLVWFGITNFLIYDPFVTKEDVEKYDFCHFITDKKKIFKECNLITFHLPLLDSTRNFLWKKEFKLLQDEVFIINTSRGWIINENKLCEYLEDHQFAGAYLDVWEEEPSDPKMDLLELENCIITPHVGAMTLEAEKRMHYFEILDR